jgi:hypothetical protein
LRFHKNRYFSHLVDHGQYAYHTAPSALPPKQPLDLRQDSERLKPQNKIKAFLTLCF